jgi:hypothetical protein
MSSVAPRRLPFGLSIGSIFASFIMIGGIQVLIAGVRVPLSLAAAHLIKLLSSTSSGAPVPPISASQWAFVIENLVLSAIFIACGLAIGSWLRRDTR